MTHYYPRVTINQYLQAIYQQVTNWSNHQMDKFEQRRQALRALVDSLGRGGISAVAKKINKEASYVSRMLYPEGKSGMKRIGEDTVELLREEYPGFFTATGGLEDVDADTVTHSVPRPPQASRPPVDASPAPSQPPLEGYARLPVLAEASAGPGRYAAQEVVQHVDVLESYIRQRLNTNPRNVHVLTARGSSMTGLIEDGDIMFVLPTTEFTDDGIYILTFDDLIRVKRLSISMATGNVVIESNDGRRPEELPFREVPHRLHIQGRVLGSWSLKNFC